MDCRVKPGNDDKYIGSKKQTPEKFLSPVSQTPAA
jgi:hypothetical protein